MIVPAEPEKEHFGCKQNAAKNNRDFAAEFFRDHSGRYFEGEDPEKEPCLEDEQPSVIHLEPVQEIGDRDRPKKPQVFHKRFRTGFADISPAHYPQHKPKCRPTHQGPVVEVAGGGSLHPVKFSSPASPHLPPGFVARRRSRVWNQGARPRAPQAYSTVRRGARPSATQ